MNWQLFLSIYLLIFIAELPDKTAFATLLLATRGKAFAVFIGVAAAFLIQTVVAVIFGNIIALAPERWVHLGAGILFLGFAGHTWFHLNDDEASEEAKSENCERRSFWLAGWNAFLVIFIAEWGDLTQIATASMVAKYHGETLTVFVAALAALWSVTAIAVFIGHKAKILINPLVLKKISVVLFTGIGFYFICTWFT